MNILMVISYINIKGLSSLLRLTQIELLVNTILRITVYYSIQ